MRETIYKFYMVWEFDKEEKWLNEMAARGLALVGVSYCKYVFEESEPGELPPILTKRIRHQKKRYCHAALHYQTLKAAVIFCITNRLIKTREYVRFTGNKTHSHNWRNSKTAEPVNGQDERLTDAPLKSDNFQAGKPQNGCPAHFNFERTNSSTIAMTADRRSLAGGMYAGTRTLYGFAAALWKRRRCARMILIL